MNYDITETNTHVKINFSIEDDEYQLTDMITIRKSTIDSSDTIKIEQLINERFFQYKECLKEMENNKELIAEQEMTGPQDG